MDKLKMHTPNKANENFKKLAELFPNALTETIDETTGEVVRAIDKDVLMQEINIKVVDGKDERYQFTWPDKKKSILLANSPISKTLRPCRDESVDFDNTENLYIEGDNLDVLKLLQETYLGKVKMIYIDPPYNTGNDFVYNDDFSESAEEYLANSGQFDEEGNRLVQNPESNGRFHTDWLNMIYPRLKVAKDLLSDDGIIFISIDDNENSNIRKLCDEIYGLKNFIVEMVNITGASQNGDGVKIQKNTESCFVYAKNYDSCFPNRVDKAEENLRNLNDSPSSFITRPEMGYTIYYNPTTKDIKPIKDYDKSLISTNDESKVYKNDPVIMSKGYIPIRPGYRSGQLNRWRWGMETFIERLDEIIIQEKNSKYSVYFKQSGYNPPKNILNYTFGTTELKKIFDGKKYFDFPKSVNMIKYLVSIGSSSDSIILDFFSGSATTAHAVMQLNAEDGGKRKFIMVQLPEETAEKSEAYKAGYKNICEIGKERIRRVGNKIAEEIALVKSKTAEFTESPEFLEKRDAIKKEMDFGFRVLKLDSTNMKDVYYNPSEFQPSLLDEFENNIKEDRTPEDLLFQVMLDLGILLSDKIEETEIDGKKVFSVSDGYLIACFDSNVTEETITEIAKQKPYYFVMRDSSMANDSVATNFEQIFATYSPDTVRKVM